MWTRPGGSGLELSNRFRGQHRSRKHGTSPTSEPGAPMFERSHFRPAMSDPEHRHPRDPIEPPPTDVNESPGLILGFASSDIRQQIPPTSEAVPNSFRSKSLRAETGQTAKHGLAFKHADPAIFFAHLKALSYAWPRSHDDVDDEGNEN